MKMGVIGLGRMGNAIAFRALQAGHDIVGYDPSEQARHQAVLDTIPVVDSIEDIAQQTRVVWLMVPIDSVDEVLKKLVPHMKGGDIIIDGGNSYYADSIRRAQELEQLGIFFLDCGTSGGVEGRGFGFCLMVGGDEDSYTKIHSLLTAIARPGGIGYIGPSGTGHYVKMIHNGIEYGMLQAYAEGFQVIKEGSFKQLAIDLEELSRIWNVSSIIRSFILELTHDIFRQDQELHAVSGKLEEGGTGQWTVQEAEKHRIAVPVIKAALDQREWSRKTGGNYATKIVAMLRFKFGGHKVEKI